MNSADGQKPHVLERDDRIVTNLTLIGGPTVLIELAGFRLLTDPTFDAPGQYQRAVGTQVKTTGPALSPEAVGVIETAHAFPQTRIVAVHNEGWRHFTESQADLAQAFAVLGLTTRLQTLEPGRPVRLTL